MTRRQFWRLNLLIWMAWLVLGVASIVSLIW